MVNSPQATNKLFKHVYSNIAQKIPTIDLANG